MDDQKEICRLRGLVDLLDARLKLQCQEVVNLESTVQAVKDALSDKERVWEFTIHIDEEELNDEMADRLYERCSDSLLASCGGDVHMDFHRKGRNLFETILSAVIDINNSGFRVKSIDPVSE